MLVSQRHLDSLGGGLRGCRDSDFSQPLPEAFNLSSRQQQVLSWPTIHSEDVWLTD